MKKYFLKTLAFSIPSLVFLPAVMYAQGSGGIVPCNGPDCNFNSLIQLINNVINYFLGISVSIAAVTFAIAGGRMLLHPNNPGERAAAKKMFQNTVFGLVIVLGSWLAVYTVLKWILPNGSTALRFLGQ